MSAEVTAAVRRAAEVQFRRYDSEYSTDGMSPADFDDTAREDLAAALDVEEMAAVMADHPDIWPSPSGWKCAGCGRLVPGRVRAELREAAKQKHQAAAIRASILGVTP